MIQHKGIKIDDVPSLGVPWMTVEHRRITPEQIRSQAMAEHARTVLDLIEALALRVEALEKRTWWSMLIDHLRAAWVKFKVKA